MRKVFCILFAFFLLTNISACQNPNRSNASTTEAPLKILEDGTYWNSFICDNVFGYSVFDKTGKEFVKDSSPSGMFEFSAIDDDLICWAASGGNEILLTRYFNVEKALYSPLYINASIGFGLVAYLSNDYTQLIVHDIFSPAYRHNTFVRNFWYGSSVGLPIEITRQFVMCPFKVVEFLDETHLYIEYLTINEQFASEVLELK